MTIIARAPDLGMLVGGARRFGTTSVEMIQASCHCGAVRIALSEAPVRVTDCNCSICRRLGALWAYYPPTAATVTGAEATVAYVRNDQEGLLAFHHCRVCGCTTHWRALDPDHDRMGVNARLLEDADILERAPVRRLDGAESWTYRDGGPEG